VPESWWVMYKNLFAACLVISIGFHIILAAFIISHKPVSKNTLTVSVQQVSLVGIIKSGSEAIKRARTNKPVWDIPGPKQDETASGLKNIHSGTNYLDTPKLIDVKAGNPPERSNPGNTLKPPSQEEGRGDTTTPGATGTGTGKGKGEERGAPDGTVLTGAQNGIIKAHLVNQPDIRYDETSRRRGEEGSVEILLEIDRSGNPRNVRLTESSGYPRLDRVALNGIRSSRFSPTLKGGRPVESEVAYVIIFRLKDEKSSMMIDEDRNVRVLE
jgi:TonB family protein